MLENEYQHRDYRGYSVRVSSFLVDKYSNIHYNKYV